MPILRVKRGKAVWELPFEGAPLLCDALLAGGLPVARPCGGRGSCGKCAVVLTGDVSPMNDAERRAGARLSCQAVLLGDCEATLPEERPMEQIALDEVNTNTPAGERCGVQTYSDAADLDAAPARRGDGTSVYANTPAGERCGVQAYGDAADLDAASESRGDGACVRAKPSAIGAAIDVGTTTLALRLLALDDGRTLATATATNPQAAIAADVMGRIGAAMDGRGALLRRQITDALAALLDGACARAGRARGEVSRMVVAGNTTMLYLLTGRDPASLARAPFAADCLFGLTEPLLGAPTYYPRCMHAFVGADATCAALAAGLCDAPETALLCDIGTNGELALWKDGALTVASTAAGPAFEGAGIVMGCGSVRGAIDRVWVEGSGLGAHTIGDAPAVGVCGSGLIDAIAALLRLERIDATGATDEPELLLRDGVRLYPRDIRAVQLAKAAIAAGVRVLLAQAGVSPADVRRLYIAGGFGSRIDPVSAATIGLLPRELLPRAVAIGNAALAGAAELLLEPGRARAAEALARRARHVALGGSEAFSQAYLDCMALA